jgi:Na+/melibiose symporter-like transporter
MKTKGDPEVPLDLRRNQLAFGLDSLFFTVGVYFMPAGTVLNTLAARLSDDKTLIGAVSLAWYVGWLLPQLVAARMIQGKQRTKPHVLKATLIFRPLILLFALWLFWTRAESPTLTVWLLILTIAVFAATDGLATAGWFDMLGRAFTPRQRARTLSVNRFVAAICGLGVGVIVERVLGSPLLPFPANYAVLFVFAWVFYEVSQVCLFFIRERPAASTTAKKTDGESFAQRLRKTWRADPNFRRMLIVRLLVSMETMAAAFYVVFAKERLGLPDSSIGVFTIALVVGGLIGIALWGVIADRFGSRRVVQVAGVSQFVAPLLAFVVAIVLVNTPFLSDIAYGALIVVMAINGAVNNASTVGIFGYAQDSAAEQDRAMYVGAVSTVAGIASIMPLVGGILIDALVRAGWGGVAYIALFGVVTVLVGFGAWMSVRLEHR